MSIPVTVGIPVIMFLSVTLSKMIHIRPLKLICLNFYHVELKHLDSSFYSSSVPFCHRWLQPFAASGGRTWHRCWWGGLWEKEQYVNPLSVRHYWTHKIINDWNSFPSCFSPLMSHRVSKQALVIGETCWQCDSGIWGLKQARLNCQAEGRFTAAEQKLRVKIQPTHPMFRWFISTHKT